MPESAQNTSTSNWFGDYIAVGSDLLSISDFHGILLKTNIFQPEKSGEISLYFTPFFAFKGTADPAQLTSRGMPKHKLNVRQQESLKNPSESIVILTLLVSPAAFKEMILPQIRDALAAKQGFDPARLTAANLLDLQMAGYSVRELGSEPTFESASTEKAGVHAEIKLMTRMDSAKTKSFVEQLISERRTLDFEVSYNLAAVRKVSTDAGRVVRRRLSETNAIKRLLGNATIGGWTPASERETTVTRDQRENIKGALKEELSTKVNIENPSALPDILKHIDKYLDNLFSQSNARTIEDDFGKQIAEISAYGFSKEDLKPDQINSIVREVTDFFSSDKKEFLSVNHDGGASFLGIRISSKTGVIREKLEKAMRDKGWKSSEAGTSFKPKGLEVFILSERSLATESDYNYEITHGYRTLQELSITVSTEIMCDPDFNYQPEWVIETTQRKWSFATPNWDYPGGTPETTYTSPPLDENHQLRNPRVTFDNPAGHAAFSDLLDHRVGNPAPYITPDGRSVEIKVKSWSLSFPIFLWADVYRRNPARLA